MGAMFLLAMLFLSLAARYSLLPFESRDFINFIGPWYDFIMENGRIQSFREEFANYSPPYLYLLSFSTFLPFSKIVSIKLVSIFFDFVLALVVFMIVRLRHRALVAWGALLTTLFAPTVILNSAMWGQCDALMASFVLLSIYFFMVGRSFWAMLAFAISFSIKLQAIFFLPVLFIFWLKGKLPTLYVLLIPVVMLITFIPSLIIGRPFTQLASVYLDQSDFYERLTMGAPNLYQWVTNDYYEYLYLTGLSVTAALFLALSYGIYRSRVRFTPVFVLRLSLLTFLLAAYFLPKMHERYFYLADITSIAYGFYQPTRFFVPIIVIGISLLSYIPYLFEKTVFDLSLLAVVLAGVILVVLIDMIRSLRADRAEEEVLSLGEA